MNVHNSPWTELRVPVSNPSVARAIDGPVLNIALVVGPGFSPIGLAAVSDVLTTVNRLGNPEKVSLKRVSVTDEPVSGSGGLQFAPDQKLEELKAGLKQARGLDAIFTFCGKGATEEFERPLLNLFRDCQRYSVPLFSLGDEMGLLIKSGFARRATPHWSKVALLREKYPEADLSETLYHLDARIGTCSGHAAALDFAVRFLTGALGADVAGAVCRELLIGFPRDAEQRQNKVDYHRVRNAPDKLKLALDAMHGNIEEPLSLDEVSRAAGVSLRQVERLFGTYLSTSPGRYYRNLRLEVARQMVEQTDLTLFEIAAATGFGAANNLSKVFKARFGKKPREFRKLARSA